jgi:peptidoglycan/xylan/chitin deacetylase (PgdA/CDA1 family)
MTFVLKRTALTAIRVSGFHRIAEFRTGGAGVILRVGHVRQRVAGRGSLMRDNEITPRFFKRLVRMVKRQFDVIAMDEVPRRLQQPRRWRRFAALTFDVVDRDFLDHAAPVLKLHGVPYTLYVTTGFVDGVAFPWWQALEDIVLRHRRIGLTIEGREQSFDCASHADKEALFDHVRKWLMTLGDADRDNAIRDLCARYGFDLASLTAQAMTWDDLVRLVADPQVSIGTSSVNYPVLSNLDEIAARREMKMGQAVAEAALGAKPVHFAYPYGVKGSYGRREILLAGEMGLVTAVSARARVVKASDRDWLMALPRIPVDGRMQSTAALRVLMSGLVEAS